MNFIPAVNLSSREGDKNYDIYSLLLSQRIIFITGEVTQEMASTIICELLYLDALSNEEIRIYINSPGGDVNAGLAIYDAIKNCRSQVSTIGIGLCASMGAFLLSSGSKGLRYAFTNCEIMIHQPLGGSQGQVSDLEIITKRFIFLKDKLISILAENCSQDIKKVATDCDRDFFMSSIEAKNYGLIDEIFETISS